MLHVRNHTTQARGRGRWQQARFLRSLLLLACFPVLGMAAVAMPSMFGDHMVLQRGQPIPVWGTATPGASLTITFAGKTYQLTVPNDGKWMLALDPQAANASGQTLSVTGDGSSLVFSDVLIGEVWLCSGQSNMEWGLSRTVNGAAFRAEADSYPLVRLFKQSNATSATPKDDVVGAWHVGSSTMPQVSAVAYYFARRLQKQTGLPVGIMYPAFPGQPIEPFLNPDVFSRYSDFGNISTNPGPIYYGSIEPLAPFAMRGAIWLQGESNEWWAWQYRRQLTAMIADWRELWSQDTFYFGIVQIHNWDNNNETTPALYHRRGDMREAQYHASVAMPDTGFVTYVDSGNPDDPERIHPTLKRPAGERLANWALAEIHGQTVAYKHPTYGSHRVEGNKLIVTLNNPGPALQTNDGQAIRGFMLSSGVLNASNIIEFHPASAQISGSELIITSPSVPVPKEVRYAWANDPQVNLYSSNGLPVVPFRTDQWPEGSYPNRYGQLGAKAAAVLAPVRQQRVYQGQAVRICGYSASKGGTPIVAMRVEVNEVPVGTITGNFGIYLWHGASLGSHSVRVVAIDQEGGETVSASNTFTVIADDRPQAKRSILMDNLQGFLWALEGVPGDLVDNRSDFHQLAGDEDHLIEPLMQHGG